MNKAGNAFNDRSYDLESGADRAAQLLALVTEVMRRQAVDLTRVSGRAAVRMDTMSTALEKRSQELEKVSADAAG